MSATFRKIGAVASIVAMIPGPWQAPAAIIATVANVAAVVTAKKKRPTVQGSVNQRIIGVNLPLPYLMGEAYSAGEQVHDVGYGGTVSGVPNPYRFIAVVHSCCGPVEGMVSALVDFEVVAFSGTAAAGWYSGWLYRDWQLGARPEADALAPNWIASPGWGSAHKLSSLAADGWSLKFDKAGKKFASGVPALGGIWRGVKVYDPRLDSTYPGGSGAHRITDEATWTYSRNPALHALAYAYGRHVNGVKVFGVDLGHEGVDASAAAAWANVCDANDWTVNGTIMEPGDKWNNLKRICETGAGEPMLVGGVLTFHWNAPRVALDTIDFDDLADGELSSAAMRPWKERINQLVPRFRSAAHQWEYVAVDAIVDDAAIIEDGEDKPLERQWDLVTSANQVAQLAGYEVAGAREAPPITLPCKPRLTEYRGGDALELSEALAEELALEHRICTIDRRSVDPATGIVTLTLQPEDPAKHAWALSQAGVAPPATSVPTAQSQDTVAADSVPFGGSISTINDRLTAAGIP